MNLKNIIVLQITLFNTFSDVLINNWKIKQLFLIKKKDNDKIIFGFDKQ